MRRRKVFGWSPAGGVAALLAACVAFVLAVQTGCSRRGRPAPREELSIGLLAPVAEARFGADRAAAALAERINAAGGLAVGPRRVPVRLVVRDSTGRPEGLMAAAVRLLRRDRVQVIIGPYFSREALPVAGLAETAGRLMLTPTATCPKVTRGRRFVFRVCSTSREQGRRLAAYAYRALGVRRAAVLYDESDAYSRSVTEWFAAALAALPGTRVLARPYPPGRKDFSADLRALRSLRPQALLLPNFFADLAPQIEQARAAGFRGVLLGGDSWAADSRLYGLPGAQGARFTTEFSPEALPPGLRGRAEALARSAGVELDAGTALTLDSMQLIFAAARRSGRVDAAGLRAGLLALGDFSGLTGRVRFPGGGDPVRPLALRDLEKGRPAPVRSMASSER